jgi:carbonic anhydrase
MTINLQNITISPKNIKGYCDLKCAYDFNYKESNSTAKNNGELISLTYESTNETPVLFNQQKYNVTGIYICSPSIHYFNNAIQAPGEIVINHTPISGGNNLSVGIPFMQSTEINTATNTITEIIEAVASNAPSEGLSVNLNMTDFTLNNIVPKKPFFTYTSKEDSTNWIVFGSFDAIPLSSATLTKLSQLIQPYNLATTGDELFFNSKGPNNVGVGDGIYISCQPTGSSKEQTGVMYKTNTNSYDLLNNKFVLIFLQVLIGCIIFIIIFSVINYCYTFLTSDNMSMKNLQIGKHFNHMHFGKHSSSKNS